MQKQNKLREYVSYIKYLIPVFSIIFLSNLLLVFFSFQYSTIIPGYIIVISFYWLIHKPALVPRIFLFIYGIFFDSFVDNPLGLSSFILIITWLIVTFQQEIIRVFNFYYSWLILLFTLVCSFLISFFVYYVFFYTLPNLKYTLINLIVMWVSYIIVHPILELLKKPLDR